MSCTIAAGPDVGTTILLVRHAAHDDVGAYLAGRAPGVHLGADGRAQARRLAERLKRQRIDAIYCSPRERARETAAAIAALQTALDVRETEALDEIDFGAWSGQSFDALQADTSWRRWNQARSLARTPNGESMLEVQARAVRAVQSAAQMHAGGTVALVSHADVIKMIVCHYLGLPIDAYDRFDIAPGSVSTISLRAYGALLLQLNEPAP
jgi:broad specificity phosphatase PhoE